MSKGICSRCGMSTNIEYGSDGLPYCSSCLFYGQNKQCWKCRMYLPASELQQYKGYWTCPICLQDMRYADRKAEEYKKRKEPLRPLVYPEQCERCGRDLDTVYIWNGRRLCHRCVQEEQEKWGIVGGGPMAAAQRITVEPAKAAKRRSLIEHLFSEFLALFGIRKKIKVVEYVAVEKKMPIGYAKPMSEGRMKKKRDLKKGEVEGLMKEEPEVEEIQKKPRKKKKPAKKKKKK